MLYCKFSDICSLSLANQVPLLAVEQIMPRLHEIWSAADSCSAGCLTTSICNLADAQLGNFMKVNANTRSPEGDWSQRLRVVHRVSRCQGSMGEDGQDSREERGHCGMELASEQCSWPCWCFGGCHTLQASLQLST